MASVICALHGFETLENVIRTLVRKKCVVRLLVFEPVKVFDWEAKIISCHWIGFPFVLEGIADVQDITSHVV